MKKARSSTRKLLLTLGKPGRWHSYQGRMLPPKMSARMKLNITFLPLHPVGVQDFLTADLTNVRINS